MDRLQVTVRSCIAMLLVLPGTLSWTPAQAAAATAAVNRPNAPTRTNINQNVNVNRNLNVNQNVNVDRNVNVTRNVNVDVDVDRNFRPVAAAAATALVIGAVVRTLPPACTVVTVNAIAYHNCSGVWYQPQFVGTQVTYVVVVAPR